MNSLDLEDTVNKITAEMQTSSQTITDLMNGFDELEEKDKQVIIGKLIINLVHFISLYHKMVQIINAIIEYIAPVPPQYVVIASTWQEKVDWFLDNRIFKDNSSLAPPLEFLVREDIKVIKLKS